MEIIDDPSVKSLKEISAQFAHDLTEILYERGILYAVFSFTSEENEIINEDNDAKVEEENEIINEDNDAKVEEEDESK
jgi:lactate dehydrogenase-like 2-hydroxyacid dehydrogenase